MRIFDLAVKDLLQILRDWKSALFLVLMPIIFTVFFGLIFNFGEDGGSVGPLPVAYPTAAQSEVDQAQFLKLLQTASAIEAVPVQTQNRSELEAAVREGEFAGALLFAADFSKQVRSEQTGALTLITDTSDPIGRTVQESVEKAYDRLVSSLEIADISAKVYAEKTDQTTPVGDEYRNETVELAAIAWQQPPVRLVSEMGGSTETEGVATGFSQSSPGMIVQFAIFGLITSAMVLVLERKSGAMKRLLTSPLRRVELIGGHVLAMFLVVLIQQLLLILLGELAFGVEYSQAPFAVFLMIVVLAFWAASLGLFIGAIAKSEEQVVTISLIAMFIFASLGGAWFPLEFAGEAFSTIGHLMPTAWAMDGFQNVIVRGLGLHSVILPAALLTVYGLIFFGLAVWRFRYE